MDIKSLITELFVEINLNTNSLDARKREDAIFDEILKDIPMDNNKLYLEHDRENNTFLLKEDEKQTGKKKQEVKKQQKTAQKIKKIKKIKK